MAKISIITINFNNSDGLQETLESVKNQTSKDYEQIIIDGGSTDKSVEVIKKFCADSDFKNQLAFWSSEKDKGIYDAMNKGIAHANGEYCLFLNSGDCLSKNDVLEEILSNEFDEDLVYFNTNLVYKNRVELKIPPKEISALYLFYRGMVNHQSILIKTNLQKKHPYSLDFKICSDRYFFLTALLTENCTTKYFDITICDYEAEDGLSSRNGELGSKECEILKDIFFPKKVQEALQKLDDYENGYKGILRKLRRILEFVAERTLR